MSIKEETDVAAGVEASDTRELDDLDAAFSDIEGDAFTGIVPALDEETRGLLDDFDTDTVGDDEEDEVATADSAYGFDEKAAEKGVWVDFPKLGRRATPDGGHEIVQVKVLQKDNSKFRRMTEAVREKHGNDRGVIKGGKIDKLVPLILARTLWVGVRTVTRNEGGDEISSKPGLSIHTGKDGWWSDAEVSRVAILKRYGTRLQVDISVECARRSNFQANDDEAASGN